MLIKQIFGDKMKLINKKIKSLVNALAHSGDNTLRFQVYSRYYDLNKDSIEMERYLATKHKVFAVVVKTEHGVKCITVDARNKRIADCHNQLLYRLKCRDEDGLPNRRSYFIWMIKDINGVQYVLESGRV